MRKWFVFIVFLVLNTSVFSQKKYDVVLPLDYHKELSYPLFIVFHGGNGNMKNMKTWWTSSILSKSFIVAYFEASTLDRAPNRWGWRNLAKERNNVKQYYSEIIQTYNVNLNEVYVGGFSLGGKMSVDLALNQAIPIKGFISLNHGGGTTEFFTTKNIIRAKENRLKAVLLSGEKDYRYKKESLKIKNRFEELRLDHKFFEIKNLGHTSPKYFSKLLDNYIDFLRN